MRCLNDAQIQALADNEAGADARAHVAACDRCAERLRGQRRRMETLERALVDATPAPPDVLRRVEQALNGAEVRGATRLRDGGAIGSVWRRTAWSAAAVAAATLGAVLFIAPMIKGPETVSAAEILAESASRLAQPAASGIEILEYELVLDGVPRELMREPVDGPYRVWRVIDHDRPGRFRFTSYTPDGRVLSSIAHDPATGHRVSMVRVDDQVYRFDFRVPDTSVPSLPELERLQMEATVAMMQASGNQLLQIVQGTSGTQYRIEVPRVTVPQPNAVWDLTHAEVLISASDFRIEELSVSGTFLKQAYSISYRLLSRVIGATVQPDVFEVPAEPGQIVIEGEGTANPARDALVGALRELARAKQAR